MWLNRLFDMKLICSLCVGFCEFENMVVCLCL